VLVPEAPFAPLGPVVPVDGFMLVPGEGFTLPVLGSVPELEPGVPIPVDPEPVPAPVPACATSRQPPTGVPVATAVRAARVSTAGGFTAAIACVPVAAARIKTIVFPPGTNVGPVLLMASPGALSRRGTPADIL
jgi:hypothetical protein